MQLMFRFYYTCGDIWTTQCNINTHTHTHTHSPTAGVAEEGKGLTVSHHILQSLRLSSEAHAVCEFGKHQQRPCVFGEIP